MLSRIPRITMEDDEDVPLPPGSPPAIRVIRSTERMQSSLLDMQGMLQDIVKRVRRASRLPTRDVWVETFEQLSQKLGLVYENARLCEDQPDRPVLGSGVFGIVTQIDKGIARKIIAVRKSVQQSYRKARTRLTPELLSQIRDDLGGIFGYCDRVSTFISHAAKWYPTMFPKIYGCRFCLSPDHLQVQLEMSLFRGSTLASLLPNIDPDNLERLENLVTVVWDDLNRKGIFHGDLHPGNVIVAPDLLQVYFIDFDSSTVRPNPRGETPDSLNFGMSTASLSHDV